MAPRVLSMWEQTSPGLTPFSHSGGLRVRCMSPLPTKGIADGKQHCLRQSAHGDCAVVRKTSSATAGSFLRLFTHMGKDRMQSRNRWMSPVGHLWVGDSPAAAILPCFWVLCLPSGFPDLGINKVRQREALSTAILPWVHGTKLPSSVKADTISQDMLW